MGVVMVRWSTMSPCPMRAKPPTPFTTRREIDRYFSGETIECLLCGRRFRRLGRHLPPAHGVSVNEYRLRFGLPWSRGLTSAASLAASGWTAERKAQAKRLARRSRFFELAHLTSRRKIAPFVKAEAIEHLGIDPRTLSEAFKEQVRTLFDRGLSDRAIARKLAVSTSTVNRRTKRWRDNMFRGGRTDSGLAGE
jgi:hypothetical protein